MIGMLNNLKSFGAIKPKELSMIANIGLNREGGEP